MATADGVIANAVPVEQPSWKEIIQAKYTELCKASSVSTQLLDACVQHQVLNSEERELIISADPPGSYNRSSLFYNALLKKDEKSIHTVFRIMQGRETKQQGVLEILQDLGVPLYTASKKTSFTGDEGEIRTSFGHNGLGSRQWSSLISISYAEIAKNLADFQIKDAIAGLNINEDQRFKQLLQDVEACNGEQLLVLEKFCEYLGDMGKFSEALGVCNSYLELQQEDGTEREKLDTQYLIGMALFNLKRSDEALNAFQKTINGQTRVLTRNHPSTTKTRLSYAYTLSELGRSGEAKHIIEDILKILGSESPTSALSLRAKLYQAIIISRTEDNISETMESCKRVLALQNEIGDDPRNIYETEFQLAVMLADARNYDEAEGIFLKLTMALPKQLGADHPRTLCARHRYAQTLSERSRNKDAEDILIKVRDRQKAVLGDSHEDTLRTCRSLAEVKLRLGYYEESRKMNEEICRNLESSLGIDHASTLKTKYQCALAISRLKNYDEALNLFMQVQKAQARTKGPAHHSTLRTSSDIALMKLERGIYEGLENYIEEILVEQTRAVGPDHIDTLRTRRVHALALAKFGKFEDAIKVFDEVRKKQINKLGEDHPSTLETGYQLGVALKVSKRADQALSVLRGVLANQKHKLGDHPSTLVTQLEVASAYSDRAENKKAQEILDELFAKKQALTWLPKLDLLRAEMYYAQVLARLGKASEGKKRLKKVLETQEDMLNIEHPVTLETKYQTAIILADMQEHHEALKLLMELHRVQPRVLSPEHPATIRTEIDLARQYSEVGRNFDALEKFRKTEAKLELMKKPEDDIEKLRAKRYRASAQARLGYLQESLETLQTVAKIQEEIFGSDHPSYLETQFEIGTSFAKLDDTYHAGATWNEVLKGQQRIYSENHPKILRSKVALTGLHLNVANAKETLDSLTALIAVMSRELGEKHKFLWRAKRYKAQALIKMGRYMEAGKLLEEIRLLQEIEYGVEHPITLETIFHFGVCEDGMQCRDEALDTFLLVLKSQERVLLHGHPSVGRTKQMIENIRSHSAKKKGLFSFKGSSGKKEKH